MKSTDVRHEIKKSTLKVSIAGLFAAGVLLSASPISLGAEAEVKPVISTATDSKTAYGCWPKSWKIASDSSDENLIVKSKPKKDEANNYFRSVACTTGINNKHAHGF